MVAPRSRPWLADAAPASAAGLLLGGAHLHPTLAPLAWLGVAVLAGTLSARRTRVSGLRVLLIALTLSLTLSQVWLASSIARYAVRVADLGALNDPVSVVVWCLTAGLLLTPALALPMVAVWLLRPGLSPRWWLPPAWLAGEWLKSASGFHLGDLIHSQGYSAPVLHSVAAIGMPATTLLGLLAATTLGEAVARRRWQVAAPVAPALLWFVLVPAPQAHDDALAGVGVVHMANALDMPPPEEVYDELVVWPEASFRQQIHGQEGVLSPPVTLDALAPYAGRRHLVNVTLVGPGLPQNAAGLTDAEGRVEILRAKSVLTPWGERPFRGLAPMGPGFEPGELPALMTWGGRSLILTICYEVYGRALFTAAEPPEGGLLVNIANDRAFGAGELGSRQAIATLALEAAETGLPAVRASLWGTAAILSSTGAVLETSTPGTTGVLRWPRPAQARVRVLYDEGGRPGFPCVAPGCVACPIASATCQDGAFDTVVLSGHSLPPVYLEQSPRRVAELITCADPSLVVLDTCLGFSSPLLEALVSAGFEGVLVGSLDQVPGEGFVYGAGFRQAPTALGRARAVRMRSGAALEVWTADADTLARARAAVDSWDVETLTAALHWVQPNLIRAPLGTAGPTALFLIPAERFQRAPGAIREETAHSRR